MKIGQWLFRKYGGSIIFLGRFTALLRAYVSLPAGANKYPSHHFFVWNTSGGSPDRFEHLVSYDGVDVDDEVGTIHGEFFVARDVPVDALTVTEGSLLIVEPERLATVEH